MPASQTEYKNASDGTTFSPFVALKATYADTSYYEDNLHSSRGVVVSRSVEEAHDVALKYAENKLIPWSKAGTPTTPISYTVYVSFEAKYKDGRKAQRTNGHTEFQAVEEALKHVSEKSTELLEELAKLAHDGI